MASDISQLKLKEVFAYTPYDHTFAHRPILSEEDFIEQFRVIPDAYQDLKSNLVQSVVENTYSILYGYAGTGKTTFLYWFKEQIEEYYTVDIVNMIKHGTGFDLKITLVEENMVLRLWDRLDVAVFKTICDNSDNIFNKYFDSKQIDKIKNYYQRCTNESKDYKLFEPIFKESNMSYSQKLILYMLNAMLPQFNGKTGEELNDIKPYLLCFDNLDELRIQYLTNDIWEQTLDAMSKLSAIFTTIEATKGIDTTDMISLLFVFREANFAVGAAQANDRLATITKPIFCYTNAGLEIAKKRLDIYKESRRSTTKKELYNNDGAICNLMEIIVDDKRLLDERLMPLFNYDYRRFFDAVVNIVTPKHMSNKTCSLFNMTRRQYNAFWSEESYMRNGRRGILMNAFIRHLSTVNFLDRIAPRRNTVDRERHCNYARMFLTVLCNLSFSNRPVEQRNEKKEAEPVQVSVMEIYKYCRRMSMTTKDFFNTITSLIDFNKSSWAHLITIYNKLPTKYNSNEYRFDFSSEKKNLDANYLSDDLKKITISANASAYIYLRYILTHFEYIAAYKASNDDDSIYDYEPLFLRTNLNYRTLKWEFEETIKNVYSIVEAYYYRTGKFFEEIFVDKLKYTSAQYCASDSVYIFKGDYDSKIKNKSYYPMFMTRLLSTHIRYLDDFRIYINKYYDRILENKALAANFKNKDAINSFILEYIEKYIALLDDIDDPAKGDIAIKLREKLAAAKLNVEVVVAFDELPGREDQELEFE